MNLFKFDLSWTDIPQTNSYFKVFKKILKY